MAELPDPPEVAQPERYRVPNRTDATFDEIAALRAEAAQLGLAGADELPLVELRTWVERGRRAADE